MAEKKENQDSSVQIENARLTQELLDIQGRYEKRLSILDNTIKKWQDELEKNLVEAREKIARLTKELDSWISGGQISRKHDEMIQGLCEERDVLKIEIARLAARIVDIQVRHPCKYEGDEICNAEETRFRDPNVQFVSGTLTEPPIVRVDGIVFAPDAGIGAMQQLYHNEIARLVDENAKLVVENKRLKDGNG